MAGTPKRILELDTLRLLAISLVVTAHYVPSAMLPHFFSFSWVGVDLFFVISGFLITSILVGLKGKPHPFRTFYWRRTLRIAPPFYLALAGLLIASLIDHEHDSIWNYVRMGLFLGALSSHEASFTVANALRVLHSEPILISPAALHTGWDITSFQDGLSIYWSLSVEEIFYLIWAPIVLKGSKRTVVLTALATLAMCPLLRALGHSPDNREYFFFFTRCDALMMGALLALFTLRLKKTSKPFERSTAIYACILVASLCGLSLILRHAHYLQGFDERSDFLFSILGYTAVDLGLTAFVGLILLMAGSQRLSWLRLKPMVYLGTISYTMYLIHIPIFVSLRALQPGLQIPLALLITLAASALSWVWIEKPIMSFRDRGLAVPRRGLPQQPGFKISRARAGGDEDGSRMKGAF